MPAGGGAATLVEVPVEKRSAVIRSHVLRAGRRPGSGVVAREARNHFGVGVGLREDELAVAAVRYPVFRVEYQGPDQLPA